MAVAATARGCGSDELDIPITFCHLPARHQQVEQNRALALLIHHQQLAGKAADQPSRKNGLKARCQLGPTT
jgi:hypothetical protein